MTNAPTRTAGLVSLAEVRAAASSIAGIAVRTPLLPLQRPLSPERGPVWLKPESLQPVGAFKIRGAAHALRQLTAEQRERGVVTHSSGNHGQALAYAGARMGVAVTVVMPDVAPKIKIEATRAYGAEVILVPPAERFTMAERLTVERGLVPIPPFDHPDIIAGQGTIGIEIIEDLPEVAGVLVPVGGGGLASGVATAVKALAPAVAVIGVEPVDAAETAEGLLAGERRTWPVERTYRTVADGVRTAPSELTFAHLRARLDGVVTVTDDEILSTVRTLAHSARLIAEPSGALAPAAVLHRRAELPDGPLVAVISGGNIDPAVLAGLLA